MSTKELLYGALDIVMTEYMPSDEIVVKFSDNSTETTQANVFIPEFSAMQKNTKQNEGEFRDVKLIRKPKQGELVSYGSQLWKIQEVRGDAGYYNLTVTSGTKHTMGKTKRPTI